MSFTQRIKAIWKRWLDIPEQRYGASEILQWLWHISRGNRLQASLNIALGVVEVAVTLSQVWAVKHAIDVASGTTAGSVYVSVGVIGLLILCDFALHVAAIYVKNLLGIKAQNRMQQMMLDRILRSEWRGKEGHHSGDVLNRLEFDVNTVVTFITETIPGSISVLALFIGAFLYLFSMDRMLAVIVTAIMPCFLVFSKLYVGRMRQLTRQVRDSDSKVQSVLQETIQHRMLIKTMESDAEMVGKLESTQTELRRHVVRRTSFSVVSGLILKFGFALGYLVAFLWAAIRMSGHTLSFGGMTAFLQLVNKIQGPARNLTKLFPAFVSVFTAAERLMELEENPLEEQGEPLEMESPCGIRLKQMGYGYKDSKNLILKGLDFDFKPGTCTAILGETGAGKTTLVRILLALVRPQEGSAEIYDCNKAVQLSPRTRCNMVYVPQGNTLMSGSIRENLLLGKLDATDEQMMDALEKSCAGFVKELPDGLDTECTEQGGGLSEGQAQRIAIARALLRDRPVMLFDEATSALDPETECRLLKNLLDKHDKTVIFITHRPAVVEYCDQILNIERTTQTAS